MLVGRTILSLTLAASLAQPVAAQSVFVPSAAAHTDGPAHDWGPGTSGDSRHLILVDMPFSLDNKTLTEIAFRRDESPYPFDGGAVDLTVRLSHARHTAVHANLEFAQNHGGTVSTAFQGRVIAPASPGAESRVVAWSNPHDVLAIPLVAPFAFSSGTLAIEIESRPVAGQEPGYWAVDAIHELRTSAVVRSGESCSPFAVRLLPDDIRSSLTAPVNGLNPGSTVDFMGRGSAGRTMVFALGFATTDIDLGLLGIGALGCHLRVVPEFTTMRTLDARHPGAGGQAKFRFQIPVDVGALSVPFYMQAIEFGLPTYTSELTRCTIAASIPTVAVSTVHARIDGPTLPTEGTVRTHRGPVIRFAHQ